MGTNLTYEQQQAQLPRTRIEMAIMMMTPNAGGEDRSEARDTGERTSDGRNNG